MAQLDRTQHLGDSSRIAEQHFNTDSPTVSNVPRTSEGRMLDKEDHFQPSRKISVIAKMKEKAKKWRQTLSRKRHGHDNTPPWGVGDEIEDDSEHHGGSNVRQRMFGRSFSTRSGKNNTKKSGSGSTLPKSYSDIQRGNHSIPKIIINDTFRAKSLDRNHSGRAPSPINYRAEHIVTENNAGILREKLLHLQATRESEHEEEEEVDEHACDITPPLTIRSLVDEQNGTRYDRTTLNDPKETNEGIERDIHGEEQVSPTTMKTITEAEKGRIAPRTTPSEKGVVEKVRDVSLTFRSEESSSSSSVKKSESISSIPVSSYTHEVEEESQGRILQAN